MNDKDEFFGLDCAEKMAFTIKSYVVLVPIAHYSPLYARRLNWVQDAI